MPDSVRPSSFCECRVPAYARGSKASDLLGCTLRMISKREFGDQFRSNSSLCSILGSIPELFEYENEVLQAAALPQVSPCAQCVEAWLSISQSSALDWSSGAVFRPSWFPCRCGSPLQARASPSFLRVRRSLPVSCVCTALLYLFKACSRKARQRCRCVARVHGPPGVRLPLASDCAPNLQKHGSLGTGDRKRVASIASPALTLKPQNLQFDTSAWCGHPDACSGNFG